MSKAVVLLLAIVLLAFGLGKRTGPVQLTVGGQPLRVEIAKTAAEREKGLSGRF